MRLNSKVWLTAVLAGVGCAGRPGPSTMVPAQSTVGVPAAFGTGFVAARPYQVRVRLTASAYLTLVRVWSGDEVELVYGPVEHRPGSWRIRVPPAPAPALRAPPRRDSGPVVGYQWTYSGNTGAHSDCVAGGQGWCLVPVRAGELRPPPDRNPPPRGGEHTFVLLATERPINVSLARARLSELRKAEGATASAVAEVIPGLFAADQGGRWGAWIVAVR